MYKNLHNILVNHDTFNEILVEEMKIATYSGLEKFILLPVYLLII